MIAKLRDQFPVGTPVIIMEESRTGRSIRATARTAGTVVEWRHGVTGSWYASHNHQSEYGKLKLLRLVLRKFDGEITEIVVDDLTCIAKIEEE